MSPSFMHLEFQIIPLFYLLVNVVSNTFYNTTSTWVARHSKAVCPKFDSNPLVTNFLFTLNLFDFNFPYFSFFFFFFVKTTSFVWRTSLFSTQLLNFIKLYGSTPYLYSVTILYFLGSLETWEKISETDTKKGYLRDRESSKL